MRLMLLVAAGLLISAEDRPGNIVELQAFRQTASAHGATLINLNPAINVWYLLRVSGSSWHLENPNPLGARLLLDENYPSGLIVAEARNRYRCDFSALEQGRNSRLIYYPFCEGRLYLRNPAKGNRTALEASAEFLRDQVWGGEKVIVLFHHLLGERYRETADLTPGSGPSGEKASPEGPLTAQIDPQYSSSQIVAANLGIALEKNALTPGAWYAAAGIPGAFVSLVQPDFIAPSILRSYRSLAANLDPVEAASLCYLIAFDLDRFNLGYALGTEHPQVGWSRRVSPAIKDQQMPGPDGIANIAPLVSTGLIRPDNGRRTIAAFTAGFKREHGAFRYGDLALVNHGSHYGFIEAGVVFSRLQPGLATVFVLDDDSVGMKTWTDADNKLLPRIKHARQNGVPLVETDPATQSPRPGSLVNQWGAGNWSGSEDEKLRTLRAGVALQTDRGKRFLIYAVFSDATPSAMARVFQAYQCEYAMLLDMNALEHTYLALYRRSGSSLSVEHLLKGMSALDKESAGEVIPRFLGFPDNRDFFYVMRRNPGEVRP